jgi:hypothetical protein
MDSVFSTYLLENLMSCWGDFTFGNGFQHHASRLMCMRAVIEFAVANMRPKLNKSIFERDIIDVV